MENAKRPRGSEEEAAAAVAGGARAGAAAVTVEAGREGGAGSGEPQGSEPGADSGSAVEGRGEESHGVEEVLRWRGAGSKRGAGQVGGDR